MSKMTIQDVIDALEDASYEIGPDANVRLALQPTYPMLGSIENICINRKSDGTAELLIACSNNEDYGCPRDAWTEPEVDSDDE